MKYTKDELNILRSGGKKALAEFYISKRKPIGNIRNSIIESKKYKEKYKMINYSI